MHIHSVSTVTLVGEGADNNDDVGTTNSPFRLNIPVQPKNVSFLSLIALSFLHGISLFIWGTNIVPVLLLPPQGTVGSLHLPF